MKQNENIVLNFLPIGMGGGLQNALNFLISLSNDYGNIQKYTALVRRNSAIQRICEKREIKHITITDNPAARLRFEAIHRKMFYKGQVCFTLFGPPMIHSQGYLLNIIGCAYSNLFYPEIDFWSYLSYIKKVKREMIDFYRRRETAKADYWIFETEILKKRAIKLCNFPIERVGVVRMAPSQLVQKESIKQDLKGLLQKRLPEGFKILYLSVANPNKRIHLIPEIVRALKAMGMEKFCFVTTMSTNDPYARKIINMFNKIDITNHFCNIGPVQSDDVATLIDICDVMCNFSRLESFSNNFVESWQMKKPLIVTESDWSREACGKGALFVNPTNPGSVAKVIKELESNGKMRKAIIENGNQQLMTYPNANEKYMKYLKEIEKAISLGPYTRKNNNIKWP